MASMPPNILRGAFSSFSVSCLDVNLGVGYAHLQYNKYLLGGEWAHYPLEKKNTKMWIGPTKFGVHLVYNIFK